jgi:hypothetical protein
MEETYLLCVDWGKQSIASLKVTCSKCGRDLAMDARNVEASKDMKPICLPCASTEEDVDFKGGLIGGKKYEDFEEALLALLMDRRRN